MSPEPALTLAFVAVSALTLGAGLAMVVTPSIFRAGLFMAGTFLGVAGLFVLLQAPFLAVAQILIYVGAIAVLILFAVMLTPRPMGDARATNEQWPLALVLALILFGLLVAMSYTVPWPISSEGLPEVDSVRLLGTELLTTYLLPFEVAGVLLLVALIGAIIIARQIPE